MRCACLAAVLCVMLATACGGGSDKPADPALTAQAPAPAADPKPTTPEPEADPEPAEIPKPEPESEPELEAVPPDDRQSETLPELPGTEVEVGKVYEGPKTLKVSMYGVSFELPKGFRTGIAPGSPAFEIQSIERPGVGVIVMKRQNTPAELRAEMQRPQDMGGGVVLQPEGTITETDGRLETWYGDAQYLAKCVALISEHGNGVAFLFGAARGEREWIGQTTNLLADGVTLGVAQESKDEQEWRRMLSGQKLTFMRSSFDRDPMGGSTGSSTRIEISLFPDGSFHYYFHDTFTITTPGGDARGNTPVEDRGRWRIEAVGAALQLVLQGNEERRYALSLSNNRVYLDNRQYFRTALE
jgi:hypothetical protein